MNSLTQNVIDIISKKKDFINRIVSSGVDTESGILYIVTGLVDVRYVVPNGRLRPKLSTPVNYGTALIVEFENVKGHHVIHAKLAIDKSSSFHSNSKLFVNNAYVCDLNTLEFLELADRNKNK